jgi:hypothetical protein
MKQYTVNLTEAEITTLKIALSAAKIRAEEKADRLAEHNKTGINTDRIDGERAMAKAYDNLFDKLFEVEYSE